MEKITKTLSYGRRWQALQFDSTAEFAAFTRANAMRFVTGSAGWLGEPISVALDNAMGRGRSDLVRKAETLLDKVMVSLDIPRDSWERSRAGAYPVVPEYLAGNPDPMRRRVQVASDRAPVRIVVDLTAGCNVSTDSMLTRGIACMALAMALSQERAVELWACTSIAESNSDTNAQAGTMWLVARSGEPLDLARVACALGSVALIRGAGYAVCSQQLGRVVPSWAFGSPHSDPARYETRAREAWGLLSTDVFIRPIGNFDNLREDPVKFVQEQLARISKETDND